MTFTLEAVRALTSRKVHPVLLRKHRFTYLPSWKGHTCAGAGGGSGHAHCGGPGEICGSVSGSGVSGARVVLGECWKWSHLSG